MKCSIVSEIVKTVNLEPLYYTLQLSDSWLTIDFLEIPNPTWANLFEIWWELMLSNLLRHFRFRRWKLKNAPKLKKNEI